eukprot:9478776-Pyramimonas_sp.AAC.1
MTVIIVDAKKSQCDFSERIKRHGSIRRTRGDRETTSSTINPAPAMRPRCARDAPAMCPRCAAHPDLP